MSINPDPATRRLPPELIERLRKAEVESRSKDQIIAALQDELAARKPAPTVTPEPAMSRAVRYFTRHFQTKYSGGDVEAVLYSISVGASKANIWNTAEQHYEQIDLD